MTSTQHPHQEGPPSLWALLVIGATAAAIAYLGILALALLGLMIGG